MKKGNDSDNCLYVNCLINNINRNFFDDSGSTLLVTGVNVDPGSLNTPLLGVNGQAINCSGQVEINLKGISNR